MPILLRERTLTARKTHTCRTCFAPAAQPGEKYRRETYVFDGRVYDWVTCQPCADLALIVWDWAMSPDDVGIGPDSYEDWARDVLAGWESDEHAEAARAYLTRRGGDALRTAILGSTS